MGSREADGREVVLGRQFRVGVMLRSTVSLDFTYTTNSKMKLLIVSRQQAQSIKKCVGPSEHAALYGYMGHMASPRIWPLL